jgi:hypothetical protein
MPAPPTTASFFVVGWGLARKRKRNRSQFNSEKCFTEVDENGNVADGIRIEVMELKPVIVKKAAKERTSGEGQSPFGKMVECDDFVDILHGERFMERGAPVDKVFLL